LELLSFNVCFVCAVNNVGKHEIKTVQMMEEMVQEHRL